MAGDLTNADFARLFRKEARSEEQELSASASSDNVGAEGAVNPMMAAAMRRNNEEQAEYESETPRGGLGFVSSAKADGPVQAGEEAAMKERKRVLTEAELRRKFTWEKHTTGFGLKMMAKMGFSGRLGKDEKGVSATLEVVQRPAQMGLGFGDFKEAGNLKQNKKIEKELKGEAYDEKEEELKAKREREALQEDDSLWRKRKVPTGGRVYKRAAEVSVEAHSKKPRNEIILDMRGPDVRVLDHLTDAYLDQDKLNAARPKLGEELIYNVRMVVNLAQGRIYDLTQKIDTNTATLESMQKEAKILEAQVESDSLRWQKVEELLGRMEKLEELASLANESLSVENIVQGLRDLRSRHQQEFEAYKLVQVVPSLVNSVLKAHLMASDMLNENSLRFAIEQFRLVQLFLIESSTSFDDHSSNGLGVFHHIREKSNPLGDDIYNYILEEALWPGAVQLVNVQWNVVNNPAGCAVWFESFRPHLSEEFASAFLHELVLPRLKKECQGWSFKSAKTMMHEWLEPWARHLDSALEELIPAIQVSLGSALANWHPSDLSVLPIISPWRTIWGEAKYAKFTHRHVLRKLTRCLHREFQVDPNNQSLDALRWVLAWQQFLPERQFVALFEGEFFPKWLKVLRRWVSDSPNLKELETWYVGWKKFFGKHQLASKPRLVVCFQGALVLLEAALERKQDPTFIVPELNPFAPSSYQDALVKAKEHEASDDSSPESRGSWSKPVADRMPHKPSHVNLKDLVEHLAIENDLTFMPKGLHDGQQVYVFGKHHILIEQGVIFMERAKGTFEPVDIQQLVEA